MKNVSLIEDRKNGGIFAAVVSGPKGVRAYGSIGQGSDWADWVNSENLSMLEIEQALDTTLIVQKAKPANKIELDNLTGVFDTTTLESFKNDISAKQLLQFIETKSDPVEGRDEDMAFEMEHMYAEEENISNWPITDIALASIDVAYKQIAISYKAKAFNLDRSASSMLLQVKGARAIWDPNMPGGGGYRCPDDTPNGGQFTNRLGTGCTFGVMRRIGRGLLAASLRDINAPITGDDSEAGARRLYNLGRSMEESADRRQQKLQEKFKRRVARRVQKLSDKDKKRMGAPSFSQIYQALNPEMARRDRARIAAGNVMMRMGADMSNAGHVRAQSRRLARKAKVQTSRPWDDVIDPNIDAEKRRFGGRLNTNFGGIYIEETGRLYDFDSLVPSSGALYSKYGMGVVREALRDDENFPHFITMEEMAKLSGRADGQEQVDYVAGIVDTLSRADGTTATRLTSSEVLAKRKNRTGDYIDMMQLLDPATPSSLRFLPAGKKAIDIPTSVENLGHVITVDENGDLVAWNNLQQMIPLSYYVKGQGLDDEFISSAFNRINSTFPGDASATFIHDGMPNLHITPVEAASLFTLRGSKPDGTRWTLDDVIANEIDTRNASYLGAQLDFSVSRISDDEFKKRFPKAWKNRDKSQDEWNSKNSRLAERLRNYADRLTGTRRQNRRRNVQATQQAVTPGQAPSVPSTAVAPKRSRRGAKPQTPGLIQRFRENQNERLRRRTVAKRRTARGRKPAPTENLRQRAALRYRRRANRLAEIPDQPEDYPTYTAGLPDPSLGLEGLVRAPGSDQTDIPSPFRVDKQTVDILKRNNTGIASVFAAKPEKSGGVFEAIEFLDRRSREGNGQFQAIPSVEQFDADNQPELQRLLDDVGTQMADIMNEDRVNGTNRYQRAILGDKNEWFFIDDTPVGMYDSDNKVYHQFSLDGKNHLFSVITSTNLSTGQRTDTIVASDFTRDRMLGMGKGRSIRDRIAARRRVLAPGSPVASPATPSGGQSLRARTRTVLKDKTTPGFMFGKTTSGIKLLPSYSQTDIDSLINASTVELDAHLDRWRKRLGITDLSLPIDEVAVNQYITSLRATDPKKAAMNATDWHNTLMLSEIVSNNDHTLIDYLKPQARLQVVTRAGVQTDGTVNPTKTRPVTPPNIGGTPPSAPSGGTSVPSTPKTPTPGAPSAPPARPTPSAPSAPSTPTAPSTPSAPPVGPQVSPPSPPPSSTPAPSGIVFSPGPVTPTIVQPATNTPAVVNPLPTLIGAPTGPSIEPGVGNASAGISYVPQLDAYIDTNTGDYLEDLSGLVIDESLAIPSMPIDESSTTYPSVRTGAPFEQYLVAPGVDATKLKKLIKPVPTGSNARTATTGIFDSFKRAGVAYRNITNGPRLRGWDPIPYVTRIDMNKLPEDPSLQGEAVLRQALEQLDKTSEVFGPLPRQVSDIKDILTAVENGQRSSVSLLEAFNTINGGYAGEFEGLDSDVTKWGGVVYIKATRSYRDGYPIKQLNEALQKEEAYRRAYLTHKEDIDNGVPLPAGVEATLDALKNEAAIAWESAGKELVDAYQSAATGRDANLSSYRTKKNKGFKDGYVTNGIKAELLKAIIDGDVSNNPFAIAALGEAKRARMQRRSRSLNIRRRAVNARLAAGGRRNTGLFDNDPDVLDPWKGSTPPAAPRTPDAITALSLQHKSEGIFEDATQGPSPLSEEQVLMLAQMVEQLEDAQRDGTTKGPVGTALENNVYENVGQGHLATIWYYNGWDSLPVVVNQEEAVAILSKTDANGNPTAVAITRGIQGTAAEQIQRVNDALRGDRFIPGQGGSAAGRGEYFTSSPVSWSNYHGGNGGTIIGVLTKDMNIVSQDSFKEAIDVGLMPGVREMYAMFGNPGLVPGHSAPSPTQTQVFSPSMVRVALDPTTGQYDANDLLQLRNEIDEITKAGNPLVQGTSIADGSWGTATIESALLQGDSRLDRQSIRNVFPETDPQATVEEIKEAAEKRAYYNAWTRQHMIWMLSLASMHQDESGANSAEAKEYNKRLKKAMAMLVFMTPENRASIMGVDAVYVDTYRSGSIGTLFTPSQIWRGDSYGGGTATNGLGYGAASRILVLNRSAMIYYQDPVQHYRDWRNILSSITYPDGTTALRPGMGW